MIFVAISNVPVKYTQTEIPILVTPFEITYLALG